MTSKINSIFEKCLDISLFAWYPCYRTLNIYIYKQDISTMTPITKYFNFFFNESKFLQI